MSTFDVLIDIDGVLYPFPEVFTPYASLQLGRELELDTTRWEFYEEWGVDYAGFVELVTQGVNERQLWWEGAPYPDVPDAIARLRAGGHRLHLVTARDITGAEAALAATNHWLALNDLVVETVNMAQDKPTVLAQLGLEPAHCIAVDDGPQHVAAWEAAGVYAVVLDRWGTYRGDHRHVPDLGAFADIVAALAAAA
jgi:HAD superfamily hydrolase (TIGR01509 family)